MRGRVGIIDWAFLEHLSFGLYSWLVMAKGRDMFLFSTESDLYVLNTACFLIFIICALANISNPLYL